MRPQSQRFENGGAPQIRIRGDNVVPRDGRDGTFSGERGGFSCAQNRNDIVALHRGYLQARKTQRPRNFSRAPRGCHWVGGTHIADDLHAVCHAGRQNRPHAFSQQWIVSELGVLHPSLLSECDRALSQTLEYEIIQPAALGELDGGLDAVTGESGPAADPYDPRFSCAHVRSITPGTTQTPRTPAPSSKRPHTSREMRTSGAPTARYPQVPPQEKWRASADSREIRPSSDPPAPPAQPALPYPRAA